MCFSVPFTNLGATVKRLYVVVRNDIPAGLQIAQACHAAREFTLYADEDVGDNLVVLQAAPDELAKLVERAIQGMCSVVRFHEPDLGGELTAAAFGGSSRKMLSSLPLALRDDPRDFRIRITAT